MSDEDWVKAAMTDDSVVVELLMRLHQKREHSPAALQLEWSVRQRRSKPMMILQANNKKKKPTPRSSPTTPLSWSCGATSVSGGGGCAAAAGDGFEESSRPPPTKRLDDATRSKATATSGTTSNKRSRKKKTLAELKEEENLLLKERRHLKRELATLRVTLEKHRATNESLKRLKLDLESQPAAERVAAVASIKAIPDQTQQNVASPDPIPSVLQPDVKTDNHDSTQLPCPNGSSKLQQEIINQENKFLLPDLNEPTEDSNSEVLDRVS